MRPLHRLAPAFIALVLFAIPAVAQRSATQSLIQEKVDENNLVTLKGNTPPAALAANDRGRVNPGLSMPGMILTLRRSPEQQAAFDTFVGSQYDPTSPNFHQWLTPDQVGEKFGPALADIGTVSAWLASHGLIVEEVSKDRMTIRFSGTAAQVEGTFHTEIHNLMVKGEPHIANMSDPQIPMALESVVLGPKALHNFLPRPLHRLGGKVTRNAETGEWERIAGTGASVTTASVALNALKPHPELGYTGGSGSNTYQIEDVTPFDFAAIYNVQPLWNSSINGTGQTIAIAGTSDINLADVTSFRSTFGLSAGLTPIIKLAHGTDPGRCIGTTGACTLDDQIENALDVEWSGAVAPGAQVELVVSGYTGGSDDTVYDSASYVVNNNIAKILNVSYGLCELGEGTVGNATYNTLWQTAATAGIAVFVATGDSGSPACDQGFDSQYGTPYPAQYGLSVNALASTQYDTAVGGTDLNWGATAAPYWNTTNSTTNGSSAKGYMPEIPWNDSCTNPLVLSYLQSWVTPLKNAGYNPTSPTDAESACNFVISWYQVIASGAGVDISFLVDTVGAGGGKSNCTTSDGATVASCTGGYSTPSWQTGVTGIPTDGKRYLPDVSFFASNGFLGSAYLICVSDWGTCVTRSGTTEPSAGEIGGTSAASPAMAGVMALINQKAGSIQGSPNKELYTLGGKQTYASCKSETVTNSSSCYFNDVDTGTIAMPCAYSATAALNSPNCTATNSADTVGLLSGYSAATSFDLATGLGSLNVANVVNGWTATVVGTNTATVAVSATPTTFTSQQGTSVTVTVTGGSGTPTGTIILTSGSFASATKTLSNGTVTFSLSPGVLAVGTDTLTAAYSGDAIYAANTGTTTVTVTAVSFTLAATSPASISAGGTATSDITVASTNGYAGTVTLSCALTSGPSGAVESPTCAATSGKSTVTLSSGTTTGTGQVTVSTTAAPSGAHVVAKANKSGWFRAAGGVALASLVLFFLPGWSRRYRNVFSVLLVLIAGSFLAIGCGGGGSSGGGTQKGTATVTVTPAKTSISETDTLSVAIAVAGSGGTATIPSGTVTLKSGTYTSSATTLSGGAATITIPAGALAVGATDTLTASYSGDTGYNSATGTGSVQVNKAATTSGTYTFTVTGTGNDAATLKATTTFTVTVN